eukprot:GHRR01012088.1.p1 GENE.GHRR01012088.1~~GHRR01012088.1.p1  ORF type:complete len:1024 (+),score=420.33 GHRR01012088.1:512-3583(+)
MPQPQDDKTAHRRPQSLDVGSLRSKLYPAPKQTAPAAPPKIVKELNRQRSLSPSRLVPGQLSVPAVKHLPPLAGQAGVGPLRSKGLAGAQDYQIPETPEHNKQQLNPLQRIQTLISSPTLRGGIGFNRPLQDGASLERPLQQRRPGSPASPGNRASLVLPGSPMAPGIQQQQPVQHSGQQSSTNSKQGPAAGQPPGKQQQQQHPAAAGGTAAPGADAGKQQQLQTQYNYLKLIYTLREYPTTEDFIYLRRFTCYPLDCNPYALEIVPFADVNQADYHTMSVRGITHYVNGASAEFASLDQWEREVQLYIALKQIRLFRQHKVWKAVNSWKHAISHSKMVAAKASLNKQLFLLSPVFQAPLQRFHGLCHGLSSMRVHNLHLGQVYTLSKVAESHEQQSQLCAARLEQFSNEVYDTIKGACKDALVHLQQQLESLTAKSDLESGTKDAGLLSMTGATAKLSSAMQSQLLANTASTRSNGALGNGMNATSTSGSKAADGKPVQDYAYTKAAAYRSEQRRLLCLIRMADFMMCDTLRSILLDSLQEVLQAVQPAPSVGMATAACIDGHAAAGPGSRPTLQGMNPLLNGSRRQQVSAAVASMQILPVTAQQQQRQQQRQQQQQSQQQQQPAVAPATAGRVPQFELEVLLNSDMTDLVFEPLPDRFQSQMSSVLLGFTSCLTSISRLYSRPQLVTGVLSAKMSDLAEVTPLAELVVSGDSEELVESIKTAVDVAFARASLQKTGYLPYRDMVVFDHQLNLASLVPAFKASCSLTGITAAAIAAGELAPPTISSASGGTQASQTTPGALNSPVNALADEGGKVTLLTFRSLLDRLLQQKVDMDCLLAAVDVDVIRINAKQLKGSVLPWPNNRLTELHRMLPGLAADLLHEFMDSVHSAQSKLSAVCTCVEEYVEKMVFLAELIAKTRVMGDACAQIHELYALLDEYSIKVPDVDKAGYVSLDNTYSGLKVMMEEVEGAKEEAVGRYSTDLSLGELQGTSGTWLAVSAADWVFTLLMEHLRRHWRECASTA